MVIKFASAVKLRNGFDPGAAFELCLRSSKKSSQLHL